MILKVDLPWPPTANTYWRRNGSRYFISTKGQAYRKAVRKICIDSGAFQYFNEADRIKLSIDAWPPDKRRRDLDNLFKSVLDSLQDACVFPDDNQIDSLSITRMPLNEGFIQLKLEKF
jgi:crossover junction endodeoxyribonuclease RusA